MNMPWLAYYAAERVVFEKEFATKLDTNLAGFVFRKLRTKYRFPQILEWSCRRRGSGRCDNDRIVLGYDTNVGVMAHEVGHALDRPRRHRADRKTRSHTKDHLAKMRKVAVYTMANLDAWREEHTQLENQEMTELQTRAAKLEAQKAYKRSPQYKLEKLRERRDKWLQAD